MHRQIPVINKIIKKKDKKYLDTLHKKKLNFIKNRKSEFINYKNSKKGNFKWKNFIQNETDKKILNENRILAKKIKNIIDPYRIMRRTQSLSKKTLNKKLREKEIMKITCENFNLMRRINSIKPYIKRKEFNNHELSHIKNFQLRCELPIIFHKNIKNKRNLLENKIKFKSSKSKNKKIKLWGKLKISNNNSKFLTNTNTNLQESQNNSIYNKKTFNNKNYISNKMKKKIKKKLDTINSQNKSINNECIKSKFIIDNSIKGTIILKKKEEYNISLFNEDNILICQKIIQINNIYNNYVLNKNYNELASLVYYDSLSSNENLKFNLKQNESFLSSKP